MGRKLDGVRFDVGDGEAMAVDVSGTGEPLLFVHGIPGSRVIWRRVTERLEGAVQAIVPDLLGFGDSSEPRSDFHAFGQARALGRLMDTLGHEAFHVVGHDFGGPTAIALGGIRPSRVRSLTLISTNAFPDTPIPGPLRLARVPALGEALLLAMCSVGGLTGMWLGAAADKNALPLRRFLTELPSRRGRRWTRRIFLDSLRNLRARYAPIAELLARVTCPTLVVWGDRDPFFPIDVGERTARAVPGGRLEVLTGCGHFVPGERPGEVAALLRSLVVGGDLTG